MNMHKDSLVSVVIPSFNGEKYIAETIESCLGQTHSNVEIIVVDDCSADNSVQIVKSFARRNSAVRIFQNEKNLGIAGNCNKGFRQSKGAYLIFIGQDDLLPEDHIEKILSEFDEDTVLVHCNSMVIDSDGKKIRIRNDDEIQINRTVNALYELSRKNFISSCGLIIKREFFEKIEGYDPLFRNFYERLTWIKMAKLGKVKYSTKSMAFHRKHDANITNTFNDKKVMPVIREYKKHCRAVAYDGKLFSFKQKLLYFYKGIEQGFKFKLKMLLFSKINKGLD